MRGECTHTHTCNHTHTHKCAVFFFRRLSGAIGKRRRRSQKSRRSARIAEKERPRRRLQMPGSSDAEAGLIRRSNRNAHRDKRFDHACGIVAAQRAREQAVTLSQRRQQQGAIGDGF